MKHEAYVDDANKVMVMRIKGDLTLDDAKKCLQTLVDRMGDGDPYPMLVDLSDAVPRLDRDVRGYLKEEGKNRKISKQAFIVTNPAVRMISKIMIATQSWAESVKFFKTDAEALAWLKEE